MRALRYIVIIAALFVPLAGCVVLSLNPYYTDDAVVDYPEAAGTWTLVSIGTDEKSSAIGSIWQFFEDSMEISLEITDSEEQGGRSSILHSTFFSVGDTVFMDTTARALDRQKEPGLSSWWAMHTLPVHLLSRVKAEGDTLTVTPINYDWLLERIKAGEAELQYVVVDGLEVFTSEPGAWMEFLKKHHTTEELYLNDNAYVLRRSGAKPEEEKPEAEPPEEQSGG